MDSNSRRAKWPSDLRNEGGMLSGPGAPLPFIFLMANSNSPIWSRVQLSLSTDGALKCFLNCWLRYHSPCNILSLLTLAWWFMNMLALDLMSVMVQPSWDITLFGKLASGVPFRPWMTFQIFVPSEFDTATWRWSFQLSVLASLIALVASRQASVHSCWFWWIIWWRQFWVWILVCMCGVIQGLDILLCFYQWGLLQQRWKCNWNKIYEEISLVRQGDYSFSTQLH